MNKTVQRLKYITADYLSAALAWLGFFIWRKLSIEKVSHLELISYAKDYRLIMGLALIPIFWLSLYYLGGYYKSPYRKSRLQELSQTFFISAFGVLILFFTLLLDDWIATYSHYYQIIGTLFVIHFFATYIPRLFITTRANHKVQRRIIRFNTLIIGGNEKAVSLYKRIESKPLSSGNKFIGFVNVDDNESFELSSYIPHLGSIDFLKRYILTEQVEEVIIALESTEHHAIERIINKLEDADVIVKIVPDTYDLIAGTVKISSLYDEPLLQITHNIMPIWEKKAKRVIDISVSMFFMTLFSPLYAAVAIGVKFSSQGPILYSHERIGQYGRPFAIYKYRSMYVGAEKNGPALATENDKRITPFGKFMRKSRLDEIPQFYNVLRGDMSLVGPRPERQFYIDKILLQAPHYVHLQRVQPGITSWGQVKYGYASTVEEMVERLRYDIIYIENMSLIVDLKVLIYTIRTVLLGKGL